MIHLLGWNNISLPCNWSCWLRFFDVLITFYDGYVFAAPYTAVALCKSLIFVFHAFLHILMHIHFPFIPFHSIPCIGCDTKHYLYINPIKQLQSQLTYKLTQVLLSRPKCRYSSSVSWLGDFLILGIHCITWHCHALSRSGGLVHTNHSTQFQTQYTLETR